ncbi:tRNA lysidine(34) synthetase TilS [Thalassorhabdus alkalitolerans]|uniref:tRNA(Ile)-lysidine synthase n=1 Tax=Thalassorhabdus alkalitolerans TaxID=2282697 RepID=A0ABW0YTF8_9BACI
MKQTVKDFITSHKLIDKGDTIVAAVSGGPDSMALLHYLHEMKDTWDLQVVAAHVEHGLRGTPSIKDAEFVEEWCREHSVHFEKVHLSLADKVKQDKGSVQKTARQARYEFLGNVMIRWGAQKLATAHHGDDQVETMLMKQTSGRALIGEMGIPVKREEAYGVIIRPFLSVTKEEILAYCQKEGVTYREDESNKKDDYLRNRFRKRVLPFLKEEEPEVHSHLQKLSEWMNEDRKYIEAMAESEIKKSVISKQPDEITISVPCWASLPVSLQRRGIPLLLKYLFRDKEPELSSIHIEDCLRLISGTSPSGQLDLRQGLRVVRSYEKCRFTMERLVENRNTEGKRSLKVPGETVWNGHKVTARISDQIPPAWKEKDIFVCELEGLPLPLTVRGRQPADRIRPAGMKGRQKVNRIFIDEKVDKSIRDHWPVIVDGEGDILWLPLLKKSERALTATQSKPFLILLYEKR